MQEKQAGPVIGKGEKWSETQEVPTWLGVFVNSQFLLEEDLSGAIGVIGEW